MSASEEGYATVAYGLKYAGSLACVAGLLILVWQTYFWLRYGMWPEIPLRQMWAWFGWSVPAADWAGVQQILAWLFDQATSVVLFTVGAPVAFFGAGTLEYMRLHPR